MNTQRKIDARTIISLANELNVACELNDDGETFTIIFETGEEETAPGCVEACNIIRAYANS
jgi:hypothetical protein